MHVQTLLVALASVTAVAAIDASGINGELKAISRRLYDAVVPITDDGDDDVKKAVKRFNKVVVQIKNLDGEVQKAPNFTGDSQKKICDEVSQSAYSFDDLVDGIDLAHRKQGFAKGSEAKVLKSLTDMYNAYTSMTKAILDHTESCSSNKPATASTTGYLKRATETFEKAIKEYTTK